EKSSHEDAGQDGLEEMEFVLRVGGDWNFGGDGGLRRRKKRAPGSAGNGTGTVLRVEAKEGDLVKAGQLLAQLDEQELAARRSAAQAGMQQASAGVTEATRGLSMAQAQADIAKKT